jgi:hypothetical protein
LHIWFNGLDYVIAHTPKEADTLLTQYLGKPVTGCWELFPEGSPLEIALSELDGEQEVTKMTSEWVDLFGSGFLASLDEAIA